MRIRLLLTALFACLTIVISADNYQDMEPLKLQMPEMKPELMYNTSYEAKPIGRVEVRDAIRRRTNRLEPDFDFFKSKTNKDVKAYKFMDDLTFVGVPLFFAGMAIKGDKAMFRVNDKDNTKKNTQLLTDFKTGIDDYTQYFGPAMTVGLKLGGYEGRSDWPRLLASAGMSYGIMAALVNGIKYTAKEMRPDGSQANSWPSGHTATSFVGATLLHKEYGLTRSPWFSVAGYGVATATGVMRVLNNRHWVSDVMSGAGIGIMSTELGYALCDLMFKEKGLLRNDLPFDSENPSFFGISMGVGLGNKSIDFGPEDLANINRYPMRFLNEEGKKEDIQFRAATVVDAEGAYFFNKYVGIGGRFRVRAMSAKSFGSFSESVVMGAYYAWDEMKGIYAIADPTFSEESYFQKIGYDISSEAAFMANAPVTDMKGIVKSDHLAEFTASAGLYFNIPIGNRFAIGTKALIGRSITQELDIDGYAEGHVKDIRYRLSVENGNMLDENDKLFAGDYIEYPKSTGEMFTDEWDYLTLGASNSTSLGTGISLTYRYKSNFSWKIFCDYDYTKKTFTLKHDPYHFLHSGLTDNAFSLLQLASGDPDIFGTVEYKKTKKMHYFTLGMSFLVNL